MRFVYLPYILSPKIHDTVTNTSRLCTSKGYLESLALNEEHGDDTEVLEGFIPHTFPGQ